MKWKVENNTHMVYFVSFNRFLKAIELNVVLRSMEILNGLKRRGFNWIFILQVVGNLKNISAKRAVHLNGWFRTFLSVKWRSQIISKSLVLDPNESPKNYFVETLTNLGILPATESPTKNVKFKRNNLKSLKF